MNEKIAFTIFLVIFIPVLVVIDYELEERFSKKVAYAIIYGS